MQAVSLTNRCCILISIPHVFDRLDSYMLWRTIRLECLTVPTARLMLYGARQDGFLFDFVPTFLTARLIRDRESITSFLR